MPPAESLTVAALGLDLLVTIAFAVVFWREAGRQDKSKVGWVFFALIVAPLIPNAAAGLAFLIAASIQTPDTSATVANVVNGVLLVVAAGARIATIVILFRALRALKEGDDRGPLELALSGFTEVRKGEGPTALLLTLNVFLLLTAYYFIKPVREALILAMKGGAEYKAYMGGAIAIALLFAVPAYARAASKFARNRLVVGVTLFFVSHLGLFYVLSNIAAARQYLGLLFYLWVGIFNMMVVAQFWAFANDVYDEEAGKRLFPLIGIGASTGAALGSGVAGVLIEPLGVYQMLLLAGALLGLCAFITQVVHVRETRRAEAAPAPAESTEPKKDAPPAPKEKSGAFGMVFKYRYLTLLAVFSLTFTFVNTNGEYMLGKLIAADAVETAKAEVTAADAALWLQTAENVATAKAHYTENADDFGGQAFEAVQTEVALDVLRGKKTGSLIGTAFSNFFFYVNILGVLLQMFVVSRLVKYAGFKVSFFILPVIAFADALAMAIVPALAILKIGKTAENATDYSLNNTLRNMLWLPTTKDMKYKAKQAVDTFFVRMGDVSSALLVALGAALSWQIRAFAISNVVLVAVWLFVAAAIVREQVKLKEMKARGELED